MALAGGGALMIGVSKAKAQTPVTLPPNYSPAVGNAFLSAALDLRARYDAGKPVAASLHNLATAFGTLTIHLEEIGYTDQIDKHIRNTGSVGATPVLTKIIAVAPPLSAAELGQLNILVPGGQGQTERLLASSSCRTINRLIAEQLVVQANQADQIFARRNTPTLPAESASCFYWGWVLFYLGLVAFFSPPPVDAILGTGSLVISILYQLFC
jgi:hypothetical protein